MRFNRSYLVFIGLIGCADANSLFVDGSVSFTDARENVSPDARVEPTRPVSDAGLADVGFADRATLLQGYEYIAGVRIYIHLRGTLTSTMPPVLFLNTGPSLGNEYLIAPMSFLLGAEGADRPERLLVFFDLRATGRSGFGTLSSTTSVDIRAHLDDVSNVIDFVQGLVDTRRVDVVGHGYGAAVAALFASEQPDRVSRLVLNAPYPATILQHAILHAEMTARLSSAERERYLEITRQPDCYGNIPLCSLELWDIIGPHFFCDETRALYETLDISYADYRASYVFIDFELINTSYDWRLALSRIRAPTTIISGPCDPTPAETALTYTASIAGARHFTIPGTGHFPMVEAPDRFRSIVSDALAY